MDFNPQQQTALNRVGEWLTNPAHENQPIFRLFGYAGTGKTTLAKYLAETQDKPVLFAAYTGKAAKVLSDKGCPATTIHSLIYRPTGENLVGIEELEHKLDEAETAGDTKAANKLRKNIQELLSPTFDLNPDSYLKHAGLLILDECSMVGENIAEDLLSFGTPILVLGDPGQLPPIKGAGYFTEAKPDIMLEEIHRQAKGSPIIQLATHARLKEKLEYGSHGSSSVITRKAAGMNTMKDFDQIITGSNKARIRINHSMRKVLGYTNPFPQKGERLICLRNNAKRGLLNGMIVDSLLQDSIPPEDYRHNIPLQISEAQTVLVHPECFTTPWELKAWTWQRRKILEEFDYAYAITCHKAQGSQWDSVFVYADTFAWDERWLYTAITRAADRVTVAF